MELMESEFFGHVRGAFTSAYTPRPGMIREAEGGTLFLDEVDSLSANAQAKLLRLVQEKEYRPVGGSGVSHADVRIIAATNRDIGSLVKAGSFRQDLYFRLNVLNVVLPPLRERRDDIPLLVGHFALKFGRQEGIAAFAQEALCQLHTYDWPGNIRELRNVVERAVLLSAGAIVRPVHLGLTATPYDPGTESFRAAKARVVADFERSYIEQLLAAYRGNVTHAARFAKKNRRAFFELMRKHKIQPETFR
jgi:two-component system response regulator GlrR